MKFLIVDDSLIARELIYDFLSPYGQCDLVVDGREAVEAFELALEDNEPYDLISLDIMMPGMDGHEVLDTIRKMERQSGIAGFDAVKVIMTTALSDSKHCIKAFSEGCESYVTKPIDFKHFLEQMRSLLGGLPEPEEQPPDAMDADEAGAQTPSDRYLIVDDDRLCRVLLADILSPYGKCSMAFDGQEAIYAVRLSLERGQPYDLICMDIMMPGTSGHDALKAIRSLEAEHGIHGSDGVKVIMTTALKEATNIIESFREGCESYISKPINTAVLLVKMSDLGLLAANAKVA